MKRDGIMKHHTKQILYLLRYKLGVQDIFEHRIRCEIGQICLS